MWFCEMAAFATAAGLRAPGGVAINGDTIAKVGDLGSARGNGMSTAR
jgi:hypothetical protein